MNPKHQCEDDGLLPALIGGILVPILLVGIWIVIVFDARYRKCVNLENGLNLGYEAVFDLSRPFFKPIAVPRYSDGTSLVRDEMWSIHVTETSVYGLSFAAEGERNYRFAWRVDTGLVFQGEDSKIYQLLVSEAGPANWDIEVGNVGTEWLLKELISRPQFDAQRCPTALLTW